MTVQNTGNRKSYTGDGSSTVFAFPYKFLATTDLKVYVGGALKTLTTDYTVGTPSADGANVTFVTAPAAGAAVVLLRDPDLLQQSSLPSTGPFPASTVEGMSDKSTLQIQRLADLMSRAFRLADGDASSVDTTLPTPSSNALVGWNASRTALQNVDPTTLATIVAYGTSRADVFTGDGATKAFTLTGNPGALANLDIAMGGVTQLPTTDYTWTGNTVTFTTAPPNGVKILIRYFQALPQGTMDGASTTFLQSGTGAVSRSMQDKGREFVSVKDFGARGDGVTNDAPAFQAAINALTSGSTHGTLYVPSGSYKLGATLSIAALKYISIVGDGTAYLGTRLLQGFNGHMFTTPGAGGGAPAVWSISNLALIGDQTTYSSSQWCGIYMTADAVGVNVYNCVFQNFKGWGVNVANLFASTFQRNIYFGNGEGGFQNTGGNTNNFLQETTQVNLGAGMYIAGNGNCMTALHLEGDLIRNNPAGENQNYYALKITGSQNIVCGGNIYTDPNNNKTPIRITAANNTLIAFAGAGKGTATYFVTLDAGATNQFINGNIASNVTGDASAIGSSWLFGISPMVPLSNGEVLFNTGSSSPPAGAGLHVGYDTTNGRGYLNSTNPGTANLPLDLRGSYVALRAPLGSDQTVIATTPGSVVRKLAITNESGAVLGYIPIYNTIT